MVASVLVVITAVTLAGRHGRIKPVRQRAAQTPQVREAADNPREKAQAAAAPHAQPVDIEAFADAARDRYEALDALELRLHGRIAETQRRVDHFKQALREARDPTERTHVQSREREAVAELELLTSLKELAYAHVFHPTVRSSLSAELTKADQDRMDERLAQAQEAYAAVKVQLDALHDWPAKAESALRQHAELAAEAEQLRAALGPAGRQVQEVPETLNDVETALEDGSVALTKGHLANAVTLFESAHRRLLEARATAVDGLMALAELHQNQRSLSEAVLALNELLSLEPGNAAALKLRQRIVSDRITNSIGMELVFIPPGEFIMGSPASELGRDDDERQRRVTIEAGFYLGTTEVTQLQWQAVMGESSSNWEGNDLPVEQVTWEDAMHFCRRLSEVERRSYRLPAEEEWEYACRADTTTPFACGMVISTEQANFDGDYPYANAPKGAFRGHTVPVASFPPNQWGLHDMHGNVWEWCSDRVKAPSAKSMNGTMKGKSITGHVLRGGSWRNRANYCRCANRVIDTENSRLSNIGLRVLLESE
jgi:formylglycine-generating enzyme required for sulfatase activity